MASGVAPWSPAREQGEPGSCTAKVAPPPRPCALAAALVRRPPSPVALAGLLDGRSGAPGFRRMVAEIFPEAAAAILAAERPNLGRAGSRVAAFLERVEAELFPVYEFDEEWYDEDPDAYDAVLRGIPFVRLGWGDEALHGLDGRTGYRLLLALCEHPYGYDDDHIALLESLATLVPPATLRPLPRGGLHPTTLHERLDGGPFAAAAEFADWLWADTGTAFLDFDDEVDLVDADWTPENVALLAEQWRRADAILNRIDELAAWLEGDPPAHFAALLRAALAPAAAATAHERVGGGEPDDADAGGPDPSPGRGAADDGPQGGATDAGRSTTAAGSDDRHAAAGEGAAHAADADAAGQPLPPRPAA